MTVCYGSVHGAVIQIGIRKQPHFTGSELNGAKPVTPRGAGSTAFISPIEFPWGGGRCLAPQKELGSGLNRDLQAMKFILRTCC